MNKSISNNNSVVPTKYWHQIEDGRIQCDLCPRACKLRNGQRGLCFVRACEDDSVVLTTYGRSSGFCLDPVEKKPLNQFMPGHAVLSFGTAGCNLACKFCQNWDISKSRDIDTLSNTATPEDLAFATKQTMAKAIAFTYNDPVIFLEYAIDTAIACHKLDIATIAVTAGYICAEPRIEFYQYMDATNVDLKAFTEKFYYKLTGAHLQPVLETLEYIKHKTNTWLEITTLVIPGENDSREEITKESEWILDKLGPDVPVHFTAFHPDWKMQDHKRTPKETLYNARKIAMDVGLNFVYTGNIHDIEGSTTYCPQCTNMLIQRSTYEVIAYHLTSSGNCNQCGYQCPGVFLDKEGHWGNKRSPVSIN